MAEVLCERNGLELDRTYTPLDFMEAETEAKMKPQVAKKPLQPQTFICLKNLYYIPKPSMYRRA